jgi:hypothetical protein
MSEKHAAAYNGDVPALILAGIRAFQASRPRSLQVEVGPSQLGNPCDHCLAAALAGWEKGGDDAWLPLIGTAVHELLLTHEAFGNGWLKEHRVTVGKVAGQDVSGNADLYHAQSGTVIDLKIVGMSAINEAKRNGSKMQYQRQVNLYGKGFQDQYDYPVTTTVIAYLPRNSSQLTGNTMPNQPDAYFDVRPYNRKMAVDALNRAESLVQTMAQYERISTMARDVFIDSLPRAARGTCYDCARYPTIVARPSALAEYATTTQGE